MASATTYFRLARFQYSPIVILPIIFGTVFAFYNEFPFDFAAFVIALIGSFFAHLGANTLNDIFDHASGVDKIAYDEIPLNRGSDVCGSQILTLGKLTIKEAWAAALCFLSIAFLSMLILTYLHGLAILIFAGVGFFFSVFYCAPPISFGYIGRGFGEIAIFASFGLLPIAGSYFVQTHIFNLDVIIASLPFGFFATLVLYNHHFSHVEADRKAKKFSPVVVLGRRVARIVGVALILAAYLFVVLNVVLGLYPKISLISLAIAPFMLVPAWKLDGSEDCTASLRFLFKVVGLSLGSEIVLISSLLIDYWIL